MLTASLAASAAAQSVPALKAVPSSRDLNWALEAAQQVTAVEDFEDESVPYQVVPRHYWSLGISLADDCSALIVVEVKPIRGNAPVDRMIGDRHYADSVSVVDDAEIKVHSVEVEFDDPKKDLMCVPAADLHSWYPVAERLLSSDMRHRIVTETRWTVR